MCSPLLPSIIALIVSAIQTSSPYVHVLKNILARLDMCSVSLDGSVPAFV